jgi:hypothetical protein
MLVIAPPVHRAGPASAEWRRLGFFGRHTKVNRCLTEGRQALVVRLAGIQGGVECAKLAPLLSAFADGEAGAEQLAVLRPHMKTCLSCRARLKEFRAAPARVAALVPPATLVAGDGGGTVRSLVESVVGAMQHKAAAVGERAHAATELAAGQKVAAVAASAAALAGGGTAVDHFANHQGPPQPETRQVETTPVAQEAPTDPSPAPPPDAPPEQPVAGTSQPAASAPAPPAQPPPEPPPPRPDPANEFTPGAGVANTTTGTPSAPAPTTASEPASAPPAPAPPAPAPAGGGGGPGEFAP